MRFHLKSGFSTFLPVGRLVTVALLFLFCQINTSAQTTRFVRAGATGNGSSWANASGDLQLMINQSSSINGDSVFVAAGTYVPKRRGDNPTILTPNDRNNTFRLKSNVRIFGGFSANGSGARNWRANATILSGNQGNLNSNDDNTYHVVLAINVNDTTILDGFTLSDGNANYLGDNLEVFNMVIISDLGGGLYADHSNAKLRNLVVKNNAASRWGGGFFCSNSPMELNGVEITSNTANEGGGMKNTFSSNIKVTNAIISGNSSNQGGACYISYSTASFTNALISGNWAYSGSAFYNDSAPVTYTNCTIAGNKAASEDYGSCIYGAYGALAFINNSIIHGNSHGIILRYADPTVSNSLVQGMMEDTALHNISGWNAPKFRAPLSYTSAPTTGGDYRLLGISPAIDAGNNSLFTNISSINSDVDSMTRFKGTIDMGAYEYLKACNNTAVKYYVDSSVAVSGNGLTWANAFKTIGEALYQSSICGNADSILVAKGTYYPDRRADEQAYKTANDRNNAFVLLPNTALIGGYPKGGGSRNYLTNETKLSGDIGITGNVEDNAYHVLVAAGNLGTASVKGFTISGGYFGFEEEFSIIGVNGEYLQTHFGGGAIVANSAPTMAELTITNNKNSIGAGITSFNKAKPVLYNVIISNNEASSGGAICNLNSSSAIVTNSVLSGNKAKFGGAICNQRKSSIVLTNVTITGNNATENGGAVYNVEGAKAILRNSIVYRNSSGFYNEPASPYMDSSSKFLYYSLVQDVVSDSLNHNLDSSIEPGFIEPIDPNDAPSPMGNFRLKNTSLLIESGSNAYYSAAQLPLLSMLTKDVGGSKRIIGNAVDIGAYEFPFFTSPKICAGSNATFASGYEAQANYKWQISKTGTYADLVDGAGIAGANSDVITLSNVPASWNGYTIRCKVNNGQLYSVPYTFELTNVWLGTENQLWENPANWSCGTVPISSTNVVINHGTVSINQKTVCNTLKISNGASVMIKPGVTLTILH